MGTTRRQFLKGTLAAGAGVMFAPSLSWGHRAAAESAATGLSDPAQQPKFVNPVPNAADPAFSYKGKKNKYNVEIGPSVQQTGLVNPNTGAVLSTPVFGYGQKGVYTWPGKTIFAKSDEPVEVFWKNKLLDPLTGAPLQHILPIDTSLHWAYSLHGYTQYSIATDGIPIVPHLHGGHTDYQYDGNPEFFFSPGFNVRGPQFLEKKYIYENSQPAGTIWYHDHALGITRLNVYAGMAGFYLIRDDFDTGLPGNPLDLPAFPYEAAFAVQDRMFKENGELFYPSYPGDPFYDDFITGEGAILPPDIFPGGGPTALAEFFGDHMVVNGLIWPKMDVEPRSYRLRFLNGCDSRFLAVQFFEVPPGATDLSTEIQQVPFTVIGSDQGLASSPTTVDTLIMETGSRYDMIFDFKNVTPGNRVIMKNIGGDDPFGGGILMPEDERAFPEMDRIMAFDVVLPLDSAVPDVSPMASAINFGPDVPDDSDRVRRLALFEGTDEFGRLQPLLGTAEPATDYLGNPINWPNTPEYTNAGLTGQMDGAVAWHSPTTENPALGDTETWEVYNATGDAHPVHLHLVHFEVIDRQEFTADLVDQPIVQHNGLLGSGFRLENITLGAMVPQPAEYVENAPKDMVTALPGQVTRIKAKFDKPGRYVWHCHILSHEDHEMMRVLHVGPGA